jgi:hypothetical protein
MLGLARHGRADRLVKPGKGRYARLGKVGRTVVRQCKAGQIGKAR